MLGLGLSLTTGGVATPAYVVLAKAFVSRVEADGGTVDSFACLKTDMAYLTSNPDAPAGYTVEWSSATVGSSAEFRINLVGGAGYTYTYAVTDTQATEVTGTGVMGGDIQAVTADLSTLVDGTVTLAVYLTGAGGDGNVVTDTANLVGVDADAQAFITAASITDSTQQSAIDTLVVDLKTAGIWTKMKAIYPIVGGTASSHKFNLKDPRDLDAAFRLTFSSGWTHSSNGMQPAGNGTFANSYCNPNVMAQDSSHLSLYSRTNISESKVDMGAFIPTNGHYMAYKYGSTIYPTINSQEQSGGTSPYTTTLGHILGNRNDSTESKFYQAGSLLATYTRTSTTPINIPIYLGAYNVNNVAGTNSSTKQFAFASIGDGLSDSEVNAFNTSVQAFQTTLGRQV